LLPIRHRPNEAQRFSNLAFAFICFVCERLFEVLLRQLTDELACRRHARTTQLGSSGVRRRSKSSNTSVSPWSGPCLPMVCECNHATRSSERHDEVAPHSPACCWALETHCQYCFVEKIQAEPKRAWRFEMGGSSENALCSNPGTLPFVRN